MAVDTRSLPGTITRGQGGEKVASGWCLVTYEMPGAHLPLDEWRGEMAVTDASAYQAASSGGDGLYIQFYPYGGVFEPWQGPVNVEPVAEADDPNRRRLRLSPGGPLIRSRYSPEELAHGFPKSPEDQEAEAARD